MKKISVIIPVYFEEQVVKECYSRLSKILLSLENYSFEMLFVDDGSLDKTLEILQQIASEDKNVKIISFSRNFGHQCAVSAGLQYSSGDAAVIIDADLQDPPEVIPQFLEKWEQGYEVVYAKRKKRLGESYFKLITAKIFYRVLNFLSDFKIPNDTGDFRLIDRKVIDTINNMPEHNKYLRGIFSWIGFKQTPLEYERQERFAGSTKYPLKKMIRFALDGIIGFTTKPLKLVGHVGLFSVFISFLLLVHLFFAYFSGAKNLATGWTSIMVAITFFSGVQLLTLWFISEYIARIYDESRNRPLYIIKELINISKNEKSEK